MREARGFGADQFDEKRAEGGEAGHVIDRDMIERTLRHGRKRGFLGILHDGQAAMAFDPGEAGDALIEGAGQDDANDPVAVNIGGGTEQGIDGGAEVIFFGAMPKSHGVVAFHDEVIIGGRDIDLSVFDGLSGCGIGHGQTGFAAQDAGEFGTTPRGEVHYHQGGSRKIVRKCGNECLQCRDATGRCANHDDIALRYMTMVPEGGKRRYRAIVGGGASEVGNST